MEVPSSPSLLSLYVSLLLYLSCVGSDHSTKLSGMPVLSTSWYSSLFSSVNSYFTIWAIGFPGLGSCGLIIAIEASSSLPIILSIFIYLCALVLGLYAFASFLVLVKVHSIYRSTGASLEKAQAEFTTGVLRNEQVQRAATGAATAAATTAARQAMNQTFGNTNNTTSGVRY